MRLTPSPAAPGQVNPLHESDRFATPGTVAEPPLGSWSATRWQYARREGLAVDVVADLGGTVTLSFSAGTWILSWDLPGRGSETVGGTWRRDGERLELWRGGAEQSELLLLRGDLDMLTLQCAASAWTFGDGAGEEPAEFVAILVRL